MGEAEKALESNSHRRINFVGQTSDIRKIISDVIAKRGIFNDSVFTNDNFKSFFISEFYVFSTKSNFVRVYVDFRNKQECLDYLKNIIFGILKKSYQKVVESGLYDNFQKFFKNILFEKYSIKCEELFKIKKDGILDFINFSQIIDKVRKNSLEIKNISFGFENLISKYYDDFILKMGKYYLFERENIYFSESEEDFCNDSLKSLINILYGDNIAKFVVKKVYMEIPTNNERLYNNIFVENVYLCDTEAVSCDINRILSESFDDLFIVLINSEKQVEFYKYLNKEVRNLVLKNRFFCIVRNYDKFNTINIKNNIYRKINISENSIMIIKSDSKSEIVLALEKVMMLISRKSNVLYKQIKVVKNEKENIINLKLNKNKMSVAVMLEILYYKVNVFFRENEDYYKKMCNSRVGQYINYDFKLRINEKECEDIKRILSTMIVCGDNCIGFDETKNKVLIAVNGKISDENKLKLLRNIKCRLREGIFDYFLKSLSAVLVKNIKVNLKSKDEEYLGQDQYEKIFENMFEELSHNVEKYDISICM